MNRINLALIAAISATLLFGGCAIPMVTKRDQFPLMYEERPHTIFVLPPMNSTTAADAKEYYSTAIPQPLAYAGFYVFPVEITGNLMKSQGMYDTEMILEQPLNKFSEYFGADAVLFTHIKKWDKSYLVLAANLTVTVEAKLKSTKSNRILWEYSGTIVADLSGQSSTGNPLVDLIARAVITGINTAAADYVPYAQLATAQLLQSVPFAKYHRRSGEDGSDRIFHQRPAKEKPPSELLKSTTAAPNSNEKPAGAVAAKAAQEPDKSLKATLPSAAPEPQLPSQRGPKEPVDQPAQSPATAPQSDGGIISKTEPSEIRRPAEKVSAPLSPRSKSEPLRPNPPVVESTKAIVSKESGLKVYLLSNEIWLGSVAPKSAAAAAGLRAGDKLVSFDKAQISGEIFPHLKRINSAANSPQGQIEISWLTIGSNQVKTQILIWEQ